MKKRTWVLALSLTAACSVNAGTQGAQRNGRASQQLIKRLVVLPATCGSVIVDYAETVVGDSRGPKSVDMPYWTNACDAVSVHTVGQQVQFELGFQGFSVRDSDTINFQMEARHETQTARDERTTTISQIQGSRFADATPRKQDEALARLGVDAIVNTRVWLGNNRNHLETLRVQVSIFHIPTQELMWAGRCDREMEWTEFSEERILEVTQCAVRKVIALQSGGY